MAGFRDKRTTKRRANGRIKARDENDVVDKHNSWYYNILRVMPGFAWPINGSFDRHC